MQPTSLFPHPAPATRWSPAAAPRQPVPRYHAPGAPNCHFLGPAAGRKEPRPKQSTHQRTWVGALFLSYPLPPATATPGARDRAPCHPRAHVAMVAISVHIVTMPCDLPPYPASGHQPPPRPWPPGAGNRPQPPVPSARYPTPRDTGAQATAAGCPHGFRSRVRSPVTSAVTSAAAQSRPPGHNHCPPGGRPCRLLLFFYAIF